MSALAEIPYVRPASLADALRARAEHPSWLVLAGGTDVMVPGSGLTDALGVVDVFSVNDLRGVDVADDVIRIGACTTYAELVASDAVRDILPLFATAARAVGAEQIRTRGTVGGNVVTCSPVGDMLPALLALDASVVVASASSTRTVAYEQFVHGYRAVDLGPDELLVAIEIPIPAPDTVQYWRKVGARAAQAIAKVSIAAAARVEDGRVAGFRLAFGGVADHPVRLHDVETLVEGERPDAALAAAVGAAVRASLDPITDVRSTSDYRGDVAGNLAARFVANLS